MLQIKRAFSFFKNPMKSNGFSPTAQTLRSNSPASVGNCDFGQLVRAQGTAFPVGTRRSPIRMVKLLLTLTTALGLCNFPAKLSATETVNFSTSAAGLKQNMRWGYDVSQSSNSVADNGIVGLGGPQNVDWVRLGSAYADPGLLNWNPVTRVGELSQAKKDRLDFEMTIGNNAGLKPYTITRGENTGDWFWKTPGDYWAGVDVDRYAGACIAEAQYLWDKYGIVCEGVGLRNEADFWVWYSQSPQPTDSQFAAIAAILKAHPLFASADIFGPSTLSPSVNAYNAIAGPVTMAESHKLGGSSYTLKSLIQTAVGNGDGFVNTEVHGVAEMLLQGHYGGSGGNFWDYADFSRGTLALSQRGGWEIGYAENLDNETAGAVYRSPEGDIRAFVGGMERTGSDTDYRFVSTDRDVYFDGFGPVREYMMQAHKSKWGEVVNIEYGGDGIGLGAGFEGHRWKLVNRQTGQVLQVSGGSTSTGANINVAADTGGEHQKWDMVRSERGAWGFANVKSAKALGTTGADIEQDDNGVDEADEYWRLSSAGGGYFYLQNYDSINYLTGNATVCTQSGFTGSALQQWRFVSADPTPSGTFKASYQFENNANDSVGTNHGTTVGSPVYTTGKTGQAIDLDGTDDYVDLPDGIANSTAITIAAWVFWDGSSNWQRIFDFGTGTTQYMYLTPKSSEGTMEFGITTGGSASKQILVTDALPTGQWVHVAVTIGINTGVLYINGEPRVAGRITLNPSAVNATAPQNNYIGKGQFSDPLFNGRIDDFRVYYYALNQAQIAGLLPAVSQGTFTWTGGASSEWSTDTIAAPQNWKVTSSGTGTDYANGNSVVFDDSATGYAVSVASDLTPTVATFSNTTAYTLSGAAGLSGTAGLVKSGTGVLNLNNVNTHTGATAINGGTVNLNGSLTGTAITVTDAALVQSGSGAISGGSALTSMGATSLVGNNTLGAVRAAGAGTISVTGGTTSASDQVSVGDIGGGASVLTVSAGTFNANKAGTPSLVVGGAGGALGMMNVSGGTVNTAAGSVWVSSANNSNGTLSITGGVFNAGGNFAIGRGGNDGKLNVSGGSLNLTGAGSVLALGSFSGNVGQFNLSGGTVTLAGNLVVGEAGSGTLTISGNGQLTVNGPEGVRVARNAGSTGVVRLATGGVLSTNVPINGGSGNSSFRFDGGTYRVASANPTVWSGIDNVYLSLGGGIIDTNGFDLTLAQPLLRDPLQPGDRGLTKSGAGTLSLSGTNTYTGGAMLSAGTLAIGNNAAFGTGTVDLQGAAIRSTDSTARTIGNPITFSANTTFAGTANLLFTGAVNAGSLAKTFTVTNAQTEFSGVISGSGARTKAGTGTLILSGANTYTGSTTVSAGTLAVTGSIAAGGTVTVASGATLTGTGSIGGAVSFASGSRLGWSHSTNSVLTDALSAGPVSVSGGAAVNLVFNGPGSTVDFSTGFWAANHTWPVLSCSSLSGTFALGSVGTDSLGQSIAGYGTFYLQQSATGVTLFYASNNTAPPLTPAGLSAKGISSGVTLAWSESAGATSYNILRSTDSGGPYELVASNVLALTYDDASVSNGTTYYYVIVAVNSNGQSDPTAEVIAKPHLPAIVNKLDNATNLDLAASWLDDTIPTVADTARWTGLTGANSVLLGSDASWKGITVATTGGAVSVGGANTLTLGTGGIDMSVASQNFTLSSGLAIGAGNQTWSVASGRTLAVATGTFTRTAGASLSLPGAGTVNATMTGLSNAALSNGLVGPWATVGTGTSTAYATIAAGGNVGPVAGTAVAGWAAFPNPGVATANYDVTGAGAVTSAVGRFANTVRFLGGTASNLTLNSTWTTNGVMNSGTVALSFLAGSGSLQIGGNYGRELVLNAASNSLTIGVPIINHTGGASSVTISGSNVVRLQAVNSYSGGTNLNAGELQIDNNAGLGTGTVSFNGGILSGRTGPKTVTNPIAINADFTLSTAASGNFITLTGAVDLGGGVRTLTVGYDNVNAATLTGIVSNGALTKLGPGGLTLSGANTYTGRTTVNAGTLRVGANERIADVSVIEINNGAKFELQGFTETIGGLTTITPGQNSLVQNKDAGGTGTGTLIVNTVAGADHTFDGILRNQSGVLAIQKTGPGSQTLTNSTGTNTDFTGGLTVSGGTLKLRDTGDGHTLGSFGSDIANSAALVLENAGANNQTFAKIISGTGSVGISATGANGSITLTGAHTYSGATTVSAGKLVLNGSNPASATTIASGATLGGTGTAGTVTVQNGGTLAPGTSVGTFSAGNTTLTGTLAIEITSAVSADLLNVSGTLNLGGPLTISAPAGLPIGTAFTIVNKTSAGIATGTFTGKPQGPIFTESGNSWTIRYDGGDGNDIVLTVSAVPTTPQEIWQEANFGAQWSNPAIAGPTADPDGDGITNMLERAFGGNPNVADISILPQNDPDTAQPPITILFRKATEATDLVLTLQESLDLSSGSWTPSAVTPENPQLINVDNGVETYRFIAPAGSDPRKFLRIQVVQP